MNKKGIVVLIGVSLLVVGCAPFQPSSYPAPQHPPSSGKTPPYQKSETKPSDSSPAQPSPEIKPVEAEAVRGNTALSSLLEQAWLLHHAGDYDRSNAVAERAQRLNASIAEVYLVMASNYYAMAELALAEQIARQGLPFAGKQWSIEQRLKQIIQQVAE